MVKPATDSDAQQEKKGRGGRTAKVKRPLNAYFLFAADVRAGRHKIDPSLVKGAAAPKGMKLIGEAYRALDDKQKKAYEQKAADAKKRYEELTADQ